MIFPIKQFTPEDKQDQKIRNILRISAVSADWLPNPEQLFNGDEIGFDIGDISVRGNVTFNKFTVTVNITSPLKAIAYTDVYYRRQTFFRRNPPGDSLFQDGKEGGAATAKCIFEAKKLLIGIYSDWMILQGRKESIKQKLDGFTEYAKRLRESEALVIPKIKQKIKELSRQSGEVKQSFKRGEITQQEYIDMKAPIHEQIVSLLRESEPKDPFIELFKSEIKDCRYATDKRKFIESMLME